MHRAQTGTVERGRWPHISGWRGMSYCVRVYECVYYQADGVHCSLYHIRSKLEGTKEAQNLIYMYNERRDS